jgi:serine/threonine-protein kinase
MQPATAERDHSMTNQGLMKATPLESKVVHELGKYTLVAELARGGMGIIHLAVAHGPGGFNKLLAVKELKPELADDQNYVVMFLEEARLAARLTHPNIVQTNEVGSEGHRHYMVMEFLDGRSLHRVVRRLADRGGLPVAAHLRVIAESLLGLHYAHELREFDGQPLGIVHRDVSPLNVFVTFDGQTKVIDFGIAKAVDSSLETQTGVLKGRVAYMAPEQAWGAKVDRRADIYSAGVMLWEAAAGRRLWPGMSDVEILTRVLREGAPRLRSVCPDAPDDLDAICQRAMTKQADDRYETATELLEDLDAHLASRDDQMTMREIGALVSGAFADERRRMNAAIEETLVRVRTGPRSGVIPTLDARSDTPSRRLVVEDLSHDSTQWFSRASSRASTTNSVPAASRAVALAPAIAKLAELRRFAPVAAACTGSLLLVFVILASVLRDHPPPPQPVAAPPAVAVQPVTREEVSPGAAPAREFADVTVRASPPSAQIVVDGTLVATNPLVARYPRDAQVHHVMAYADGFEPRWREVSFANDVSLDIVLERHPTPAAQPPAPRRFVAAQPQPVARSGKAAAVQASAAATPEQPPQPPAPSSRVELNASGGHTPLHPIQTSNPYGAP